MRNLNINKYKQGGYTYANSEDISSEVINKQLKIIIFLIDTGVSSITLLMRNIYSGYWCI